ncbi:DUF1090 domain-containing protein [Salmonella enterica subsp. enterica]|nr:DUF1090 domain-containing protein [Salmonella enterica subsp. enterica]EDT7315842.1 DUF1090 domain-containing protein [Salmonella enterica subsp. enterica]
MKQTRLLLPGMLGLAPVFFAMAAPQAATGCEAKRQNIEKQIEHTRNHTNEHRVADLQKALSELNANCTDEGLRSEREADIREKERKVEERRQELAEAHADGRTDKIGKKERKLEDAQAELDEARSMLNK